MISNSDSSESAPRATEPRVDSDGPAQLDVVLFGASGFTGRLVAEYLLAFGPPDLRIGLAGRDAKKLEDLRTSLGTTHAAALRCPIFVADSQDREALDRLVQQTRVLCTTVGPYGRYGPQVVDACAASGTHYCDLTGEVPFIRRMIDAHEAQARTSGARIVHCCGFDSIPSDLGCLMISEALVARGARPKTVRFYAGETKGGFSGGTVASLVSIAEELEKDPNLRRLVQSPYALNPADKDSGPDGPDQLGVRYDRNLNMWTGPFLMAAVNTRIVRRTHALRGFPYGDDFRYSECTSTGRGASGIARALALTSGLGGALLAMSIKPLRKLIARSLPQPGEGPSEEARKSGYFVCRLVADGLTPDGQTVRLKGEVRGQMDPGYGETAKMLGESAICLARDALPVGGGSWTPATAMGSLLIERLRRAGMTFHIFDS